MKPDNALYLFLRWCPGGIGVLLRQVLYPLIFGKCGKKILVGRFVDIRNPKKVYLGDHIVINDNVTFDAADFHDQGPALVLENNVFVGAGSRLHASTGKIVLQAGSSIGSFCILAAKGNITVGEDALLAAYCTIGAEAAAPRQDTPSTKRSEDNIQIHGGCWLGVRSSVLPGISVGEGSVIGAHAIVQKTLPPFVVAVGRPAKVIRNRRHG